MIAPISVGLKLLHPKLLQGAQLSLVVVPWIVNRFDLVDHLDDEILFAQLLPIAAQLMTRGECAVIELEAQTVDGTPGVGAPHDKAASVMSQVKVNSVVLPPFWFDPGTLGYHQVVNAITAKPGTPKYVIVSSDPNGKDELPDLVGSRVGRTHPE